MAKYELKKMTSGEWRIWARYTPFKGGATQSKIAYTNRAGIPATVESLAEWVNTRRHPDQPA